MKKYLLLTILAISIGFFMGKLFLEQYDNYEGLKLTSSNGEILYFINYGEYDSFDDMEHNTQSDRKAPYAPVPLCGWFQNSIANKL